jgi:hypothetical protein
MNLCNVPGSSRSISESTLAIGEANVVSLENVWSVQMVPAVLWKGVCFNERRCCWAISNP